MKTITITVHENFKSIPAGFIWKNIPQFAIITGVNRIGKTQLLDILNQKDKNGMSIDMPITTIDEDGNRATLVLPSPQTKSQNLSGLITYFNDIDNRLNNIAGWENTLKNWEDRISWIEIRLKEEKLEDVQKRQLKHEMRYLNNNIKSYQQMIVNATIFAYEEELRSISIKSGKNTSNITEEDIRKYANPYFNDFSGIEDFEKYIRQEHEEYKEELAIAAGEKDNKRFQELANQEKPYEIINRLFIKYGFGYFRMLDPFPKFKERNGEIRFVGKQGEEVEFGSLSSGEQMIVKFIVMSLGRNIAGHRINTLILDEPDAHLHPTMSKMMVDILHELSQPKEVGGGDIRVIITTHSPSTVAFAPEGSLFVIEKNNESKRIRSTSAEEAVNILSDGIFTYDKAMKQFSLAVNSDKDILVFVEGKTDILHLNRANELLGYNLLFDVIDMHDAGSLANFIKSTPTKLFPGKKLIALFDADNEGFNNYKSIKGDDTSIPGAKIILAIQCENNSFAMTLVAPSHLNKYCPIEFLYSYEYLKIHDMLEKRSFPEYQNLYKASTPDELTLFLEEYNNETGLRPFKTNGNNKDAFSKACALETNSQIFSNF